MAKASQTGTCNIKVGVKLRPLIEREAPEKPKWKCEGNTVVRVDPETGRTFNSFMFDKVYDTSSTNNDIFEHMVQPLVEKAVKGFNATILAYGQTSSGKTYTMMGTETDKGIVPLCMDYIFQAIDKLPDARCFLLGVNFLEVYNEKIRDLLAPEKTDLKIYEDASEGVKVDCQPITVANPFEMMDLLKQGNQNKAIGETSMNERSSRSHTIFRIMVQSLEGAEGKPNEQESVTRLSHINLVDLAGSERASQTHTSGQRYKEGCAINRSLLQLGNVVQKLSDGKGEFIDYRSSKLTRILHPSLSGNANIAMICNVAPVALEQTQCTLQFAMRAMTIKLSPHLNEVMDEATLIKRHAKRIKELEMKLKDAEQLEEKNQTLQKEMDKLREMVILSSLHVDVKEDRERALRRQTWGGPELRRKHLVLPTLHEEPYLLSRPLPLVSERFSLDSSVLDRGDTSIQSSLNISNLSSEEQPSSMSMSLDNRSSLGSNVSTRISLDPGTPPSVLRHRILQLQKKVDNSGTPQSVLRQRISMLQTQLSQLSTNAGTSSELLKERLGVLSDSPTKTPVSAMKERFDTYSQAVTPPGYLREQIKKLEHSLEMLEEEYKSLQEFTTLERQCSAEDLQKELESVKKSLEDCETMYLEKSKQNSELWDENNALREMVEQLQIDLENTKRELDANKMWSCKNNEQQLHWKKELMEYKEKLNTLTNESKDWHDEKDLMRGRYEEKISELQRSLSEAWAQQKTLQATLDSKTVVLTSEDGCQTSKDEEECDSLRERMFFMDQEIANLNMELLTKQESLHYTTSEIEKLKTELAQSNKTHVAQMHQKEQAHLEELQQLKDRIEELSVQKITMAIADVRVNASVNDPDTQDEKNNLLVENETINQKLQELTRNYEESQHEIEVNKLSMNDMQNKIEELCEERKLLLTKIDEFEGKSRGVFEYQHDSWTCLGPEVTAVELQRTPDHSSSMLQSTVREMDVPRDGSLKQLEEDHKALTQKNMELTQELTRTLDIIKQQGLLLNLPSHLTGTSPEIGDFLTQHITELLNTKISLESKLASLRVEVGQLQEDNAALTTQLSVATNAVKEQVSTCDALRKQVSELQDAPSLNKCVSDDVASGVKRLIAEMRALNSSFSIEVLKQMTLPELIEKFISCIFEKQMDCFNKLQVDIQNMEEKNLKLKTDLREKMDMIQDLEYSKSEVLQQMSETKAHLSPSLVQELEESESCYQQQIETLQATLQECEHKSEQLEIALGEMKQSYEALVEERRTDAERISQLEASVQVARETVSELEQQLSELRKRDGLVRSAPDGISAEETAMDHESNRDTNDTELEFALSAAKQRIQELESEVANAGNISQDKMHDLWQELQKQTSEKEHFATEHTRLESAYNDLQEKINELSAQFNSATSQLVVQEVLEAKNKELTQFAQFELENKLATCRADLEQQIQAMTSERDEIVSEKLKLEEQLCALTDKMSQLKIKNGDSMIESPVKNALNSTMKNIDSLSLELQQQINLSSSQAFKITKLEAERTELQEQIITLTQKVAEKNDLKEQLQVSLETEQIHSKEQTQKLQTERTELQEQITTLTQKLAEENDLKEQLQVSLEMEQIQSKEQTQKLQTERTELQEQITTLTQKLAEENDLKEQLQVSLEMEQIQSKEQTQKLEAERTELQEQITTLTQKLAEESGIDVTMQEQLVMKLQEAEERDSLLQEKIRELQVKLQELEAQAAAGAELATKNAELQEWMSTLSEENSQMELTIEQNTQKYLALQQQVVAFQQIKEQLTEVTERERNLKNTLETSKSTVASLEKELKEQITTADELSAAKLALEDERRQLLDRIDNISKELESRGESLTSEELCRARDSESQLKDALSEAEAKVVSLGSELEQQVSANKLLSEEKAVLDTELTEAKKSLSEVLSEYEKVAKELESNQARCESLESDLAQHQQLSSQLDEAREIQQQLKRELQDSEDKLVNLKSELDLQAEANEQLASAKSSLEQEQQELQLQMKEMAHEFERVTAQVESHEVLSTKYEALEQELTDFQALQSQLKTDLESEHKLRAVAQVQLAKVEAQLQVLTTHYSELEMKHLSIQQENEELHRSVFQMQTSLQDAEKFNETFKAQISCQEENIQSLQKEITQLQATNVELETFQRNSQQQLQAAHAAQQEAELACKKLQSDLTAAHTVQQETELVYDKYRTDLTAMSREFEEQGVMVETLQNDLAKSNMLLNAAREDKELLMKRLEKAVLEIEEQKIKLEEAEDEFQDMLKSYKENSDKRIHFEEQVCKLELEVDELQAKVANYEKEAVRLKTNPEISQQSLAFYQQELQNKSARLAEVERMAADSKHAASKYEAEVMELRRNLADKRGEVALMEKKMLMDDLPHQKEAERCRRQVEYLEQKLRNLQSELRHVRNTQQEATFHDCSNCRRKVQRTVQATQTSTEEWSRSVAVQAPPDNETLWDRRDGYLPSSAITEAGRMYGMKQQLDEALTRTQKLESERSMFKDELRKRNKMIMDLQRTLANKENKGQVPMTNQKS